VVNGGSNSVSVFAVGPRGNLALVQTASSGGLDPISVTIHGIWVYVLNNGSATVPGNISGFVLSPFGHGPTDTQALNAAASSPEQVGFTPNGRDLLVTEKASNTIDVFPVNFFGLAGPAVTTTLSSGIGPYGFGFTPDGVAVVSEAAYGGVGTFWVNNNGTLSQISQVADGQLAPCWVAVTASGNEVFAANAHSGTVSAYDIAPSGTLALLPPAVQANPGIADTDLAIAGNSNLYISDQPDFDASAISPAPSAWPPRALQASKEPHKGGARTRSGLALSVPFSETKQRVFLRDALRGTSAPGPRPPARFLRPCNSCRPPRSLR
jgi:DNA-binding beta-propeller fold protein YncE